MSIRKVSSQTTANRSSSAATATTPNIVTIGTSSVGSVVISNVIITDSAFTTVDDTAIDSAAGGYIRIIGSGFNVDSKVYVGGALASAFWFQDSTELRATLPATASGTYSLMVFNGSVGAIWAAGITFSGFPTVLSSLVSSTSLTLSIQLLATGDTPLIFSLSPISNLPSGASLSSSGVISGTVDAGVYSFIVLVNDTELQTTQQTITLSVALSEPYFKNTALLLSGDGTNSANNSVFSDSSTNAFAVTRNGNTTQGSYTPFSPTGWSGYFDGTGDYLAFASNAAFGFGTGDFTWEAWVYFNSTGDRRVLDFGSNNLLYMGSNTLVYYQNAAKITSNVLAAGQWYHVAVVRGSGTTKMYINGTQNGVDYADTVNYATSTLRIGADSTATQFMHGYISNVRIVKGIAVYTGAFTPPTSALSATQSAGTNIAAITAGATSVLTLQDNRFIDNSSNAFAITRNGDTKIQAFSPFVPSSSYSLSTQGGSAYFDGTGDYLTVASNAAFTFGTGDFTIEGWIYLNSITTLTLFDNRSGVNSLHPVIYSTGTAIALYVAGANAIIGANLVSGQWYHIAVARSSGSTKLFVNGVQSGSTYADTNDYTTSGLVGIGGGLSGANLTTGYISNVRVVKGTAIYTAAFTPPTAPVSAVANTSLLLNFTDAGIFDATTRNVIETIGTVAISTSVSKYGTGSVSYNTKTDALAIYAPRVLLSFPADFTVECWVYPTDATVTNWGVVDARQSGGTAAAFVFGLSALASPVSGSYRMSYYNAAYSYGTGTILSNVWTHVAWVRVGTTMTFYVNGVAGGTATLSGVITGAATTNPIWIGHKDNNLAGYGTVGYIDDLRITNSIARYTGNFTPPINPMELQ